jgi:hypothetical protein
VLKPRQRRSASVSRPTAVVAVVARLWAVVMLVASATVTRLLPPTTPPARSAVMTCAVCGPPVTPTSRCPSARLVCSDLAAAVVGRALALVATSFGAAMTALQAAELVLPLLARRRTRRLRHRSMLSAPSPPWKIGTTWLLRLHQTRLPPCLPSRSLPLQSADLQKPPQRMGRTQHRFDSLGVNDQRFFIVFPTQKISHFLSSASYSFSSLSLFMLLPHCVSALFFF